MRSALLAVVVAACSSSTAAPVDRLQKIATLPAWDVAITANRITVLDDGFASLTTIDSATGKPVWTQKVATTGRGRHMVLVNGASLIAWFGDTAQVIDAATGALRGAPYATVMNGGGCWLDVKDGACARRCPCSFTVADCATGALRGKQYELAEIDESDEDGGRSAPMCAGDPGWLHGTTGSLALISGRSDTGKKSTRVVAGVDLATGKEVWSRAANPMLSSSVKSPDGKTCYFASFRDDITVVDCRTGKLLWTAKTPRPPAKSVDAQQVTFVPRRGVFRLVDGTATLFAERTGAVLWTAKLPPTTLAWPQGSPLAADSLRETTRIAILDPATGKTLGAVALPVKASVHHDPSGGFAITSPTGITAHDATGTVTGTSTVPALSLGFGTSLVVADTQAELVVLERGTLVELARIPGKVDSVHVEGPLGARRFAVYIYNGKTIGTLGLYSYAP
jgi:outer membrane protein assembly factor BamB